MFLAKCAKCKTVLGAIRDPSRFTWIRCRECGFQNSIQWCVDPNEQFVHPDENMVNEREADLHADAMRNMKGILGR